MNQIKISVITPSLNQAAYIERTIESVLNQIGDFQVEYIVVDGGSTDGTHGILDRYSDRIALICQPDDGQSDAINKGMARASGDVVCWLNSDDVLLDGCFKTVADVFREQPDAKWTYGKVRMIDDSDREVRSWITQYKNWRMRRFSFARLLQENWLPQMGVFWRRDFGQQIGAIRNDLHFSMDYDLWLRFAKVTPGVFIDQYLAAFRWHDSSKTCRHFDAQHDESYRVVKEHAGGAYKLSLLAHRVLAMRTRAVYRLLS